MTTWILAWLLSATALPAPADATLPPPATPEVAPVVATSELLARLAPRANPEVLALALEAMHCAKGSGVAMNADRLAVIDYSRVPDSNYPQVNILAL